MTPNGKQFTITREMLQVASDQRWPDVVAGVSTCFFSKCVQLSCSNIIRIAGVGRRGRLFVWYTERLTRGKTHNRLIGVERCSALRRIFSSIPFTNLYYILINISKLILLLN